MPLWLSYIDYIPMIVILWPMCICVVQRPLSERLAIMGVNQTSSMGHYSSLIAAAWSQGCSSHIMVRPLVDTLKFITTTHARVAFLPYLGQLT